MCEEEAGWGGGLREQEAEKDASCLGDPGADAGGDTLNDLSGQEKSGVGVVAVESGRRIWP